MSYAPPAALAKKVSGGCGPSTVIPFARAASIAAEATAATPRKKLSTFNRDLMNEVDIRPAEIVTMAGVQVFIVKPHNFDPSKKYPLILNVHGGPQSQWVDSFRGDWQVYPGAGYVVAFPNPRGSSGFGSAFTAAISGDWDGKVMEDIAIVDNKLTEGSGDDTSLELAAEEEAIDLEGLEQARRGSPVFSGE